MSNNSTIKQSLYLSPVTVEEEWFTIIFLSVVIVVTIVGNVIALHAFIISPELKKATYYFIATLCISDLMVAMFSIPFWIYVTSNYVEYSTGKVPVGLRKFISSLDIFCATWSITSLAMISIERFICISYALRYFHIMTSRRVVYMLVFIMFYASTTTVINYFQGEGSADDLNVFIPQLFLIFLAYMLPVMVKLFTYGKIFQVAKKQAAEINKYNLNRPSLADDQTATTALKDIRGKKSSPNSDTTSHSNSRISTSPLLSNEMDIKGKLQHEQSVSDEENSEKASLNPTKVTKSRSLKEKLHHCFKNRRKRVDRNGSLDYNKNRSRDESNVDENTSDKANDAFQMNDTDKSIKSKLKRVSGQEPSDRRSMDLRNDDLPNGSSSPILKVLRASATWSPSNSPLLFRKHNSTSKHKRHEQRAHRFKKELRATKVVGLIIGTFVLCWTPFMILMALFLAKVKVTHRAILIAKNLHYLNSAINPILYVVLNKVYRRAVHKSLHAIKSKLCCP